MIEPATCGHAQPLRRRRRGPTADTRASRRALQAEISKAASLRAELLDERVYPTLCRLLVTGEHWATNRPKSKTFRFEGSAYRWSWTNLGRLIVSFPDGRPIVGSGPGLMWTEALQGPGGADR